MKFALDTACPGSAGRRKEPPWRRDSERRNASYAGPSVRLETRQRVARILTRASGSQAQARRCFVKRAIVVVVWLCGLVGGTAVLAQGPRELSQIPRQPALAAPAGVSVARNGTLWIVDSDNDRLVGFDPGSLDRELSIGSTGVGNGQFRGPLGIAADDTGNLYVADTGNHRVQKFSTDGVFQAQWGSMGSENGQFQNPSALAVDVSGNVYVADSGNHRIQKFSATGAFLGKWGAAGPGPGQFQLPAGLAIDTSGRLYVADSGNQRVQQFTIDGVFIREWGAPGGGPGRFRFPVGVSVDPGGNVYVVDRGSSTDALSPRVQKFTGTG